MKRIKMFEAQQGQTNEYKQVDMISLSHERLEEFTEGEVTRVRSVLEDMGFEYSPNVVHHYFYLGEDAPKMVFFQTQRLRNFIGRLRISHFIVISKTEDDWWQVEFILEIENIEDEDCTKVMFRCDGLRGLMTLLKGHVANKVKEIKSLKDIMRSVSSLGL
jgi:hypothetical protein